MYTRASQDRLMEPLAALKLLQMWVWIPSGAFGNYDLPDILQTQLTVGETIHRLKKMNDTRFPYRKKFWWPVLEEFNTGTPYRNHKKVQDLCMNLFLRTFPTVKGAGEASGLVFDTHWYRKNKKLAFTFFQALQTLKLERMATDWQWHECLVGDRVIKIFDIQFKQKQKLKTIVRATKEETKMFTEPSVTNKCLPPKELEQPW